MPDLDDTRARDLMRTVTANGIRLSVKPDGKLLIDWGSHGVDAELRADIVELKASIVNFLAPPPPVRAPVIQAKPQPGGLVSDAPYSRSKPRSAAPDPKVTWDHQALAWDSRCAMDAMNKAARTIGANWNASALSEEQRNALLGPIWTAAGPMLEAWHRQDLEALLNRAPAWTKHADRLIAACVANAERTKQAAATVPPASAAWNAATA